MALQNGQSELDQLSIRFIGDSNREIKTFDDYSFNQNFLIPTAGWNFTISTDNIIERNELFVMGAKIEIASNDRLQCTGYIDKVERTQSNDGGIQYKVSGRDILGPIISGCIDPQIKINSNQNVLDFLISVLSPFGIDTIYVSDEDNLNIITGYPRGVTGKSSTTTSKVGDSRRVTMDGKQAELVYKNITVTQVLYDRPDLKTLKLDQRKPKVGDGAYDYLNRILARLGLKIWAHADGSGVVVDKPRFNVPAIQKIIRRSEQDNSYQNNVLEGTVSLNGEYQPCCVVSFGPGGGGDGSHSALRCIAINELVGLDISGNPIKQVNDIIAKYPNVVVLPIRQQLVPKVSDLSVNYPQKAMFVKDNDSRTIDQLKSFTRKQLSMKQKEYLVASYKMEGHTQNGYPWAVNTLVDVDDDVLGIHQPLWVFDKTFSKSRSGGTFADLKLILPYSLEL